MRLGFESSSNRGEEKKEKELLQCVQSKAKGIQEEWAHKECAGFSLT